MARHGHRDVFDETPSEFDIAIQFFINDAADSNDKHFDLYIFCGCWRWGGQASSSTVGSASLWFASRTGGIGTASLWFVLNFAIGPLCSSRGIHKAPKSYLCCSVQGDHGQTVVDKGTNTSDSGVYGLCTAYVNRAGRGGAGGQGQIDWDAGSAQVT